MENRLRGLEIPIPPSVHLQASPPAIEETSEPTPSWPSTITRPLSDIRELTEPSLIDLVVRKPSHHALQHKQYATRASPPKRNESLGRKGSLKSKEPVKVSPVVSIKPIINGTSSEYSTTPEASSLFTIPQSSIPQRVSSQKQSRHPSNVRKPSLKKSTTATASREFLTIPNRGQSRSPVKDAGLNLDPVTSDIARRVPSKTYIRSPQPLDMLEFPMYKHPRVKLELQVSAPVFAGGGTVEGFVKTTVDDNERLKHRRSLGIGAISVDLLGYEEVSSGRRAAFLALGTELLDQKHPPPPNMIESHNPLYREGRFWTLSPSTSALPFSISLPLDTGPPPFQSKHANIKFLICVTALIEDAGKHYRVRTSHDVQVLPTYDPEKALTSLPSPLTAYDELHIPRPTGYESVKLTAGLHRQVWVSGGNIFVDVHVANKSQRLIRKLELNLERNILYYKHTAATTIEKSAGQARIFESNDQANLATGCLRSGSSGWSGIDPHMSETRTCALELPRGQATVKCGKYFEVRYFLNIIASASNTKVVCVQLPIILIHMNSLDVVPNSVAQVAAAIQQKRAVSRRRSTESKCTTHRHVQRQRSVSSPSHARDLRRRPSYGQGRAFAAPRQQSLDRQRAERADLDGLCKTVDTSPRKHVQQLRGFALKKVGSAMSFGNISVGGRSTPSSSHSRLQWLLYQTPQTPKLRTGRTFQLPTSGEAQSLRNKIRLVPSFDSARGKKSTTQSKRQRPILRTAGWQSQHHIGPPSTTDLPNAFIAPHALGLSGPFDGPYGSRQNRLQHSFLQLPQLLSQPPPTPTASSFREKLDRSRFEFKAVRRKASGGLKERGLSLWEHVRHREREKEGWI
ncbi:Hypothetical protein R9X50_00129500 [Acrodontium crateriforme]|uniref:Arrestin C-terminal-like domain-containing protein n=1 Tax=Acrodontium crateriforme TaxID=150365 RepID=A0AAQ3M0I2_9PEZI|nr:Hypothetical protein R9X50_00129500 [Acrodontium crateriforme]